MRVTKLPSVGETVTGGEFSQAFGGKGANQAVAAARAGGAVTFVTCVGDDSPGNGMKETFNADGIDTRYIKELPNVPSGSAVILVNEQGDNCIAVAPGANGGVSAEQVRTCEFLFRHSDVLVMQMEISPDAVRCGLEMAAVHGLKVVLNYAPVNNVPVDLNQRMNILVVNEQEAGALLGREPVENSEAAACAQAIRCRGPETVIITLGSEGVVCAAATGTFVMGGHRVDSVDTTAAGDTFCGALSVAVGEGRSLESAVRFANAAAALSVTRRGAQPSIPRRGEIDAFLEHR